jgi:hypothetical protein
MAAIGLIDPLAAEDPRLFRAAMDEILREVAPRIRGLRDDPAVQELLDDPEIIAMLESGNTIGLIGHPGVRELAARVSKTPTLD